MGLIGYLESVLTGYPESVLTAFLPYVTSQKFEDLIHIKQARTHQGL
jgi:hypothetical protein